MASNLFRNGDSGAVHSREALRQREIQANREDCNDSTRPNQVTVREVQQMTGKR
jgi:hypothetical protein